MMSEDELEFDVICIGAGFSGLTAAYTLLKAEPDLKICILEAKDRVGGRTHTQKLKCADADGNDDAYEWEFGGMWVGSSQLDVMELLAELNIGTYKQYLEGRKCIRLNADKTTQTYTSTLPSVGVLSTLDLGQTIARVEKMIKSVNPADPWSHPDSAYLDSLTVAEFLNKYSFTAKVKEMMLVSVRATFGTDSAHVNALYFLAYCSASGGLQKMLEATPGGLQEFKIKGGSQQVCIKLVDEFLGNAKLKLSAPVTRIDQLEDSVVVHTAGDVSSKYTAKYVIIATPPHQIMRIKFSPNLPYKKMKLHQFMPVGHLTKVIVTYRKAFWKIQGFSGEVVTTDPRPAEAGPLGVVFDATSDNGHPALVCFIGGDQATTWGDKSRDERRLSVLGSLSEHFSIPELMDPIDYGEKDWGREAYNGGCPVNIVSPGVMKFYNELKSPVGRLEFAGTESSEVCCGYMSGAINTGKRAARKVLERLNTDRRDKAVA